MERVQRIEIRVSPAEKKRLEALARERGVSISAYVRDAALGHWQVDHQTVQSDPAGANSSEHPDDPWKELYGERA